MIYIYIYLYTCMSIYKYTYIYLYNIYVYVIYIDLHTCFVYHISLTLHHYTCCISDGESQHSSRKGVPKRRLSRNNSAKKNNGSFRGGSLKNVMEEEVEADMDSVNLSNHDDESGGTRKGNDIKQTRRRGISRNNSGKRRVTPIMNSEDDHTSHVPARRLSRGNSARNGSFRGGSLKNVLEDKEADMDSVNLGGNDETNAEVSGERRRSYPPSSARSDSFRTNSLRSIRL